MHHKTQIYSIHVYAKTLKPDQQERGTFMCMHLKTQIYSIHVYAKTLKPDQQKHVTVTYICISRQLYNIHVYAKTLKTDQQAWITVTLISRQTKNRPTVTDKCQDTHTKNRPQGTDNVHPPLIDVTRTFFPSTSWMARLSTASPMGVDVACALTCPTASALTPASLSAACMQCRAPLPDSDGVVMW